MMYKVYGWWLGPNWPAADKYFYLRLTVEKIAFAAFNKKYFRPYSCDGSNSTVAANSVYSKP